MNIDQLRYLTEIALHGSISKAADSLYLSQPSVSEAISKLEKELGEPLLRRGKNGVTLTAFGLEVLPYVQNIIDLIELMPKSTLGHSKKQRLTFSVSNGGFRYFTEAVSLLYKAHAAEGIHITLLDQTREEALQAVSSGDAELGGYAIWDFQSDLLYPRLEKHNVAFHSLGFSPVSIAVGPNNPLFTREEDWVTLEMIQAYPILYSSAEHIAHLFKALGLNDRRNLLVCRGRAGRGELLNWTDAVSISASYFSMSQKAHYYPNRRLFLLKDSNYISEKGYISLKGVTPTALAKEYIDILQNISSHKANEEKSHANTEVR